MDETRSARPGERSAMAQALAHALEADAAGIAGALLETLDRLDVLLAVKEVASGRYVHANARMAELFGRAAAAELIGLTDAELMDPAAAATIRAAEQTALAHDAAPILGEQRIDRDGRKREFSVMRSVIRRADGAPARHVLAVWTELTNQHEREHQLKQALAQLEAQQVAAELQRREIQDQALRDGATGLYQRVHFDDQLRREVDLSSREHREFALVSIALDPFSDAVKALGREARIRVLEALGRLLRGNTRAMDASCRLDEDRFAILLSGVGLATAHSRMEGLRRQCATQIVVLDGRDLGFTVAMGVASFPHTAHTEADLMNAADLALQEAQKRGGNHVALASIRFELGAA
ncbi:MAG TPA: diguanylate cyclase [Burkholderiaceae bacterium]|jgi:diguanylate cyclase (GGDEF)-like protein/PAS domain S-box-containing protein